MCKYILRFLFSFCLFLPTSLVYAGGGQEAGGGNFNIISIGAKKQISDWLEKNEVAVEHSKKEAIEAHFRDNFNNAFSKLAVLYTYHYIIQQEIPKTLELDNLIGMFDAINSYDQVEFVILKDFSDLKIQELKLRCGNQINDLIFINIPDDINRFAGRILVNYSQYTKEYGNPDYDYNYETKSFSKSKACQENLDSPKKDILVTNEVFKQVLAFHEMLGLAKVNDEDEIGIYLDLFNEEFGKTNYHKIWHTFEQPAKRLQNLIYNLNADKVQRSFSNEELYLKYKKDLDFHITLADKLMELRKRQTNFKILNLNWVTFGDPNFHLLSDYGQSTDDGNLFERLMNILVKNYLKEIKEITQKIMEQQE